MKVRPTASTIFSAKRPRKTFWCCDSRTRFSSRSGTRATSIISRSRRRKRSGWKRGPAIMKRPGHCATWCKIICSSCFVWWRWKLQPISAPTAFAMRKSKSSDRSAHHILSHFGPGDAAERSDDFDFLIANAVGAEIGWSFHRHQSKQLEQMTLHHVAQCPGLFIIAGPRFHPERFRRRDLEMIDVARVPERLENRVRESQHQNVLRGLFAEKMVDAVGLTFIERVVDDAIQLARRGKIGAERFFDDDARPASLLGAI